MHEHPNRGSLSPEIVKEEMKTGTLGFVNVSLPLEMECDSLQERDAGGISYVKNL